MSSEMKRRKVALANEPNHDDFKSTSNGSSHRNVRLALDARTQPNKSTGILKLDKHETSVERRKRLTKINIQINQTLQDESMKKFKTEMEKRIENVNVPVIPDFG